MAVDVDSIKDTVAKDTEGKDLEVIEVSDAGVTIEVDMEEEVMAEDKDTDMAEAGELPHSFQWPISDNQIISIT